MNYKVIVYQLPLLEFKYLGKMISKVGFNNLKHRKHNENREYKLFNLYEQMKEQGKKREL